MIKNRTAQLIFQAVYCTLGLVGCFASLGIFDNINLMRWDFYVHFTNISNFLCLGVMLTALIQTAKKAGVPVILDTSGAALKASLRALPTIIKPNLSELAELAGIDVNDRTAVLESARQLCRSGIETVIVSLGSEGVLYVSREAELQGIAPKIDVQNTVGCGDSMVAGLAVAISRNLNVEDALRLAMATAAANAADLRTGWADPRLIEQYLPQCQTERILESCW